MQRETGKLSGYADAMASRLRVETRSAPVQLFFVGRWVMVGLGVAALYCAMFLSTVSPLNAACGTDGELARGTENPAREAMLLSYCTGSYPGARGVELVVGAAIYLVPLLLIAAFALHVWWGKVRLSRWLALATAGLAIIAPIASWTSYAAIL